MEVLIPAYCFFDMINWLGLFLAVGVTIRYTALGKKPLFGFFALAVLVSLHFISFLLSSSVGWAISTVNIFHGLILALIVHHYKKQILFMSLISLVLALWLRWQFVFAHQILEFLIVVTCLVTIHHFFLRRKRGEQQQIFPYILTWIVCMCGLTLLLSDSYPFVAWIILIVLLLSVTITFVFSPEYYRNSSSL